MAELSRLGQPDQSGWTTLDRIGAAARKAREYISPWGVVSPTDVAGFAPGGGLVQAWQDSGRGLANLKAGNYGQAAADYGSMALNTAGELLPVAKLGMAMLPAAKGINALADVGKVEPQGITAYHGSPHDFDRFDMSKIGTGEGAQAYGHGLYFAESEGIAKGYRDRIAGAEWIDKRGVPQQTNLILGDVVAQLRKDGMGLIDAEENASFWSMVARDGDKVSNLPGYASIKKVLDEKGIKLREKGALYQVRINANPDDFLDWDKPLSEQAAVWKRIAKDWGGEAEAADRLNLNPSVATGQQYMNAVAPQGRGDAFRGLSERLKEQGIPGIKYLDGGSRGAGDGTRNFVVFDDKLVEILKKYGWVPGMAIPAAAMMEYQQQGGSAPQM